MGFLAFRALLGFILQKKKKRTKTKKSARFSMRNIIVLYIILSICLVESNIKIKTK